jgi:poly-gamma-glutamate system protein
MYIGLREKITIIALAGIALLAYWSFSWLGLGAHPADYGFKLAASKRTLAAELAIRDIKPEGVIVNQVAGDAPQEAMIGLPTSPITTDPGSLKAKITSTNPNFAGVVVSMLRDAGVRQGDAVAVAYTGSFPALDIATVIAIETLGATPIVVSSAGASTWGANDPELTILDMESELVRQGIIKHKSLAASLGGDYRVRPMSSEGRRQAADAITRNKVVLLNAPSITDSVEQRMVIYKREAGDRPIKAFVNVGGGLTSTGVGQDYAPGLTVAPPRGDITVGGLIYRFGNEGVPVINLTDIAGLAQQYRLPVSPLNTPDPGQGGLYRDWTQVRVVAGLLLVALSIALFVVRFTVLAPATDEEVDTYFGTAPRSFRTWLKSFGIRLPVRAAPVEAPAGEDL